MTDESDHGQASLWKNYIDQMSGCQGMTNESQSALHQLRQDAQTDGLNVDALNLLIQVRARNLPDGGAKIFNDLVVYALGIGIEFDRFSSPDVQTQSESPRHDAIDSQSDSLAMVEEFPLLVRLKLPIQIGLGALLSAAMLWYLR